MQQQQFLIISFVLCCIFVALHAVPVHYDQRQDGQLNVHANLENFVIIIAPISGTSSSSSSSSPPSSTPSDIDTSEFSFPGLLELFEFRKNLLTKNKLEHKSGKKKIEVIEVVQNEEFGDEEYPKETRNLKIKSEKKKVADDVGELTLIGDSIENCGPGRFRDRSGICQFDGSLKN